MSDTDLEKVARDAGLPRVGARPSLGAYLVELWRCRHFATTLARYRVEAQLNENRLGLAWVVLRPLLNAAVYGVVFGLIMDASSRPDPFVPYLVTGVFVFEFFAQSFKQGARSITSNLALVRSLSFPRMLLPVASVVQQVLQLVPMMAVLAIIVLVLGEPLTWSWLVVVPALALMTLFNTGVALISARLTVHMRDFAQLIPFITRLMFYTTGIFYSLELTLADHPTLLEIARLNPVHSYVELVRQSLMEGYTAYAPLWIVAVVASLGVTAFGVVFFWRAEERYGQN